VVLEGAAETLKKPDLGAGDGVVPPLVAWRDDVPALTAGCAT